MGWSIGYDENHKRDIGYGVPAICDFPSCRKKIDRGLAFVCGGEPYGGEMGCGLFFCEKHRAYYDLESDEVSPQLCERCGTGQEPFTPQPDTQEWINWKLTDDSWADWRAENPEFVAKHPAPKTRECQECEGYGYKITSACCGKLSSGGECRGDCVVPEQTQCETCQSSGRVPCTPQPFVHGGRE